MLSISLLPTLSMSQVTILTVTDVNVTIVTVNKTAIVVDITESPLTLSLSLLSSLLVYFWNIEDPVTKTKTAHPFLSNS